MNETTNDLFQKEPAPSPDCAEPSVTPAAASPKAVPPLIPMPAESNTAPPDTSPVDGPGLQTELHELRKLFDTVAVRLVGLESLAESTSKQLGFLPPQVRALGSKIESVAASLSDSRYRGLLLNVLLIFDLVDQPLRVDPSVPGHRLEGEHRRNYEVLRTQLRQILEANGFAEISTDGVFNPEWQRALETVSCEDHAKAGRICRVLRPGFRTTSSVLRYAEVSVWSAVSESGLTQTPPKDATELPGESVPAESRQQTLAPTLNQSDVNSGGSIASSPIEERETTV